MGGQISCRLTEKDDLVIFTVTDSGIGMTAETQSRIFEKFYQGDTSHSGSGNGIGLNIVYRVLTLANGEIKVESEYGKGTAFTVTLPKT